VHARRETLSLPCVPSGCHRQSAMACSLDGRTFTLWSDATLELFASDVLPRVRASGLLQARPAHSHDREHVL